MSAKKSKSDLNATGSWRAKNAKDNIELERPVSGTADNSPPDWLTDEEATIWVDFVSKANEMKTFKKADHFAMGLFCRCACDLLKAQKDLRLKGTMYAAVYYSKDGDENSVPKKHPLMEIVKQFADEFNKYAMQFGFNPLSRTKLMIVPYDVDTSQGTDADAADAAIRKSMGLKVV